ncbi:MAG: SUMF1/EgtB/PvdO family nonheme iron enzyme [Candidatus Coatesbacteria bacterium]|nr:SUMF1/EgtB/PvdO family nonheme iron enzyme [Candidatus Coatesbacteria bacterium]
MHLKRNAIAAFLGLVLISYQGCSLGGKTSHADKRYGAGNPPSGMVYVPPGEVKVRVFERRHEHGAWLKDYAVEEVAEGFFIDKYEFPNVAGEFPLSNVSFIEAQSKCHELGKRLCSMHEWLRACQGPDLKDFCYGKTYIRDRCNASESRDGLGEEPSTLEASGMRPECKSDYGVYDMTGNLWEWTSDSTSTRYSGYWGWRRMIQLGGCYGVKGKNFPSYVTNGNKKNYSYRTFGFRCCMDAD